MNRICSECEPFEAKPLAIARSRHFKARLNGQDQRAPGRLIIATHAHIPALSEWTEEHWVEFGRFEGALERALKDALDPGEPNKLVNASCLMNLAREEGTHTHWHIVPRYRKPVTLTDPETGEALSFQDDFYGQPYSFDHSLYRRVSPALARSIIQGIQSKLDLDGIEGAELRGFAD